MLLRLNADGREDKNGRFFYLVSHITRWMIGSMDEVTFWTSDGHRVNTRIKAHRFQQIIVSCL